MIFLALVAVSAFAADLVRHPYPQQTTDRSTTIVWTTERPSTGEVWYGIDEVFLDEHASSLEPSTQHEVRLDGLAPDTTYHYAVYEDGRLLAGRDGEHFVRTSSSHGEAQKFRVWVVGDSGTGGQDQRDVRDAMVAWAGHTRPDLYLHVGDIAYNSGTEEEFTANFFAQYTEILRNTTFWPCLGNHDSGSSDPAAGTGPYFDAYVVPSAGQAGGVPSGTEAYYAFDYANVHFMSFDSQHASREPEGAMLQWAAEDLAATEAEWVVAYWHHAPYSKGSHDSDGEPRMVEMRENVLPILEAGGVDLVLTGHSHIYERSYLLDGAYETPTTEAGVVDWSDGRPDRGGPYAVGPGLTPRDGTLYVVSGHGGASSGGPGGHPVMYRVERAFGSVVLDFHQNRLSLANVRADGVVSDRAAMLKGEGLLIASPDGSESFPFAETVDLSWATVGEIDEVDVHFSCDGGRSWRVVAEGIENTGHTPWVVPPIDSADTLVRVQNSADPSIFDESNGVFRVGDGAPLVALPFGSEWAYSDDGTVPGETWTTAAFDDTGWERGWGQLGYGEGDETTRIFDAEPNHPSVYFRAEVELSRAPQDAELRLLFDDGILVWINGAPVFDADVVDDSHHSWATGDTDPNELATVELEPASLVVGTNLIAALVKSEHPEHRALSFDLQLEVTYAPTGGGQPCEVEEEDPETGTPPDTDTDTDGDEPETEPPGDGSGGCPGCRSTAPPPGLAIPWAVLLLAVGWRRRGTRALSSHR